MEYMKERVQKTEILKGTIAFTSLINFMQEGCFHLCSISEKQNYGKDTGSH